MVDSSFVLNGSELHPLALEGVLTNRGHARSKADYYAQHLSLRVLCHSLMSDDEIPDGHDANITDHYRATSPTPVTPEDEKDITEKESGEEIYGEIAPPSKFSMRKAKFRRRGEVVGDVENLPAAGHSFISKKFGHRSAVGFCCLFPFSNAGFLIEPQASFGTCAMGRRQGCWST
jgi:hypothetical protein